MSKQPHHRRWRCLLQAALLLGLLPAAGIAEVQSYAVLWGKRQLGTLRLDDAPRDTSMLLTLDNAPLGIKNGTFEAVARARGGRVDYLGQNRGSETRDIAMVREAGAVTTVSVTPQSEMTEMSEGGKAPRGVVFPPEVFAALAKGRGCPEPMALFDGRRVVQLRPVSQVEEGTQTLCEMSYKVVMGPGYVSPFHFRSFGMELAYQAQRLTRMTVSGGGFAVTLLRR